MSRREFRGWKLRYKRSPFGIVADDQRHAQVMVKLTSIAHKGSRKPIKIKINDIFLCKVKEEFKKVESLLYADISKPWLLSTKSQEELALEGQALLKKQINKYK